MSIIPFIVHVTRNHDAQKQGDGLVWQRHRDISLDLSVIFMHFLYAMPVVYGLTGDLKRAAAQGSVSYIGGSGWVVYMNINEGWGMVNYTRNNRAHTVTCIPAHTVTCIQEATYITRSYGNVYTGSNLHNTLIR